MNMQLGSGCYLLLDIESGIIKLISCIDLPNLLFC